MCRDLIEIFRCLECGSKLVLKDVNDSESDIIIDGIVLCENGHEFKIKNRIRILSEDK